MTTTELLTSPDLGLLTDDQLRETLAKGQDACDAMMRSFQQDAFAAILNAAALMRMMKLDDTLSTSNYEPEWANILNQINKGVLCPEAYLVFGPHPRIFSKVRALPIPEQERLAKGGKVDLVVRGEQGPTILKANPLELSQPQRAQVFAPDGHIRTDTEQTLWLKDDSKRRQFPADVPNIEVKKRPGGIYVKADTFISHADLARYTLETAK